MLAILLVFPQRPARAQTPFDWIGAVSSAISIYQAFDQFGSLTLQNATDQIAAKIQAAQADINNHMDGIVLASQRACVNNAIAALDNESVNRGLISPDTMQADATDAQHCVDSIVAYMSAVGTPSVDQLGFALAAIEPLVGMLNANAGWATTAAIFSQFRTGNTYVSDTLMASVICERFVLWGDCVRPCQNPEVQITCTAYNGGQGFVDTFLSDRYITQETLQAKVDSLVATSYSLAQKGLATFP